MHDPISVRALLAVLRSLIILIVELLDDHPGIKPKVIASKEKPSSPTDKPPT